MKKQTNTLRNVARLTILRFVLNFLLALSLLTVNAQDKIKPVDSPVHVQYLGSFQNGPVFQVEFLNDNNNLFIFSIKDDNDNVLYVERLNDKKYSKKFRWNDAEEENLKLIFTLYNQASKQTQVFEMNTNVRTAQDVVITRL